MSIGLEKKDRLFWLDISRFIAIISITMNHAINRSYQNYSDQICDFLTLPLWENIFKATITVFSHLGVPLFLMISGALLLHKKMEDEKKLMY